MNIRERAELYEAQTLSPFASKSAETKGRKHPAEFCDIRTEFQKDRDRITHSKAFRRLMHKTQVFISPEGDHYRTRLTHTLEVAQIARTIARALRLNEDLTEAIALGHDLGHTPFGHTGEDALDSLVPGGFKHNVQSVRVVEVLENSGDGLNLTYEVLDGILNHRTECAPATLEGKVVQLSDKIAYMTHDIEDAIRAKLITLSDIPRNILDVLGPTSTKRIDLLVRSMVEASQGKCSIELPPELARVLRDLRSYLFENVYVNQLHQRERGKIQGMLKLLYEHYISKPEELPEDILARVRTGQNDVMRAAADNIAGMTDRFAMKRFEEIFMPAAWEN
ncbi:MAG: deoxyguanosinetriphosphate triphosphohydrolase [Defluviitaleaceae bacterium]|nr:deoxyguanosinetriphosphate triphosphohydrolase [Defluviitaleaceae bacterium]